MTNIIDLDFYRKFRVVLPVQPSAFAKDKSYKNSQRAVKPCRRRRKNDSRLPQKTKNRGDDNSA